MSKFFSPRHSTLKPYVPGEQPQDMQYVKLNTNESPFPPSEKVIRAVEASAGHLQLYSDPESAKLRQALASLYGISTQQVLVTNGSDEVLNFAFWAFADEKHPLYFPDISYGFYPVFAQLHHIPYHEIPLTEDFSIRPQDYFGVDGVVVIANPNAPTGKALSRKEIEQILVHNPNQVVIVDEAYVDFGGESAIPLIEKYDNLLVTGTFSKSRSMAGARLGFGIAQKELINDLITIQYATNPYNVNTMTSAAGIATLEDNEYYMDKCRQIMETRAWTTAELQKLGFKVLPSCANFVFAASDRIDGGTLYQELKKRGVLIRHFTLPRIANFNRITIGNHEQMEILIQRIREILEENHA